jgi:hypothetical protein
MNMPSTVIGTITNCEPDYSRDSPHWLARFWHDTGRSGAAARAPLGSWWGLIPAALLVPILAWRLLREEIFLAANLPGYDAYRGRVRCRLVPIFWSSRTLQRPTASGRNRPFSLDSDREPPSALSAPARSRLSVRPSRR